MKNNSLDYIQKKLKDLSDLVFITYIENKHKNKRRVACYAEEMELIK